MSKQKYTVGTQKRTRTNISVNIHTHIYIWHIYMAMVTQDAKSISCSKNAVGPHPPHLSPAMTVKDNRGVGTKVSQRDPLLLSTPYFTGPDMNDIFLLPGDSGGTKNRVTHTQHPTKPQSQDDKAFPID